MTITRGWMIIYLQNNLSGASCPAFFLLCNRGAYEEWYDKQLTRNGRDWLRPSYKRCIIKKRFRLRSRQLVRDFRQDILRSPEFFCSDNHYDETWHKIQGPVIVYGTKSRFLQLNTVWQIDNGSNVPRLVTATFDKKKK